MAMTNRDRISKAIDLMVAGLAGPVDEVMRGAFEGHENWNERWAARDARKPGNVPRTYRKDDLQILLRAIVEFWWKGFEKVYPREVLAFASELKETTRNPWAHTQPFSDEDTARALDTIERLLEAVGASDQATEVRRLRSHVQQVSIGRPAGVAASYQQRGFDTMIEQMWSDGGDRRIWLRGGPGLGKSYSARRIMQGALAYQGDENREDLLLWVDSADPSSFTSALSQAVDRMPQLRLAVAAKATDRVERQARALFEVLATSAWRWLIVLDNADAVSLIEAGLIPPGGNPNGRVLITTLSRDQRIRSYGRVVLAELFTPAEAEAYLRAQLNPSDGRPAPLSAAPEADTRALASAVGYHPLALSIAAATIAVNNMAVTDWITEFTAAELVDAAADEADQGGYPHLIGATWQIALEKASRGLPNGVVERAAAVAAVLNPDGHPTWLWEREAVAKWVAGDSALARHHGVPVAVRRLIDYSIVDLVGDTWKQSLLTIHQLAARAVRELIDKGTLAELGESLLEEFLDERRIDARYTQTETVIKCTQQLLSIPGLSQQKRSRGLQFAAHLQFVSGEFSEALEALRRAYEIATSAPEEGDNVAEALQASLLSDLGTAYQVLGRMSDARESRTRALEIYQRAAETDHALVDEKLASTLWDTGRLQESLGQERAAEESYTRALQGFERLPETGPDTDEYESFGRWFQIGQLQEKLNRLSEAEESLTCALDLLQRHQHKQPTSGTVATYLVLDLLGSVQKRQGRLDEALKSRARGVETVKRLNSSGSSAVSRLIFATAHENLADLLATDPQRKAEVHEHLARAVEITAKIAEEHPGDFETPHANSLIALGKAQMTNGQLNEALDTFTQATNIVRLLADMNASNHGHGHRRTLAGTLLLLGSVQEDLGRVDDAEATTTRAVETARRVTEDAPGDPREESALALALMQLGRVQSNRGKYLEAAETYARAVAVLQMLSDINDPGRLEEGRVRSFLWHSLWKLGKAQEHLEQLDAAAASYARAVQIASNVLHENPSDPANRKQLLIALSDLHDLLLRLGRLEEAEALEKFFLDTDTDD